MLKGDPLIRPNDVGPLHQVLPRPLVVPEPLVDLRVLVADAAIGVGGKIPVARGAGGRTLRGKDSLVRIGSMDSVEQRQVIIDANTVGIIVDRRMIGRFVLRRQNKARGIQLADVRGNGVVQPSADITDMIGFFIAR